jgi:hypothetical protein
MRFARMAAGLTAIAIAALGLSLAAAGPAAAATGSWHSFGSTNPITRSWHCGPTGTVTAGVSAQVCLVQGQDNRNLFQAATIVRNNRPRIYTVGADANLQGRVGNQWSCSVSGVGANSWSVCFGATITIHLNPGDFLQAIGDVFDPSDGATLGLDPSPSLP